VHDAHACMMYMYDVCMCAFCVKKLHVHVYIVHMHNKNKLTIKTRDLRLVPRKLAQFRK